MNIEIDNKLCVLRADAEVFLITNVEESLSYFVDVTLNIIFDKNNVLKYSDTLYIYGSVIKWVVCIFCI